jgi:hypothetical protein
VPADEIDTKSCGEGTVRDVPSFNFRGNPKAIEFRGNAAETEVVVEEDNAIKPPNMEVHKTNLGSS